MKITKIVVTGGPCAGKSTAMNRVQSAFEKMGYRTLFISETATELITGGVSPQSCGSNADYQLCQMELQLEKERIYEQAARTMDANKVLIVCDRGVIDNKAYMTQEEFETVLKKIGMNETELRDRYDGVFHLVTAAKGAEDFYTTSNNAARRETIEEAVDIDNRLISAWTGHPHLRVIDNHTGFEEKMKMLISEIAFFLGEPEPLEIERKYLIEYPDLDWLEHHPYCRKVEITQTYFKTDSGEEIRLRQRGLSGSYVYYQTIKRKISDIRRIEIETKLTRAEFLEKMMNTKGAKKRISKTRYCLMYEGQYFEIDVFPFWNDQAFMEIELRSEDQKIQFPPELKIIREVSSDPAFTNSSLAKPIEN